MAPAALSPCLGPSEKQLAAGGWTANHVHAVLQQKVALACADRAKSVSVFLHNREPVTIEKPKSTPHLYLQMQKRLLNISPT